MLLNDMANLQGLSQPARPTYSFPSPQAANAAMGRVDVRANNRMQRKIKSPYINDAHRRYEQAFDRGDLNSPDIIGVDPAQFGYGPDMTARPQLQPGQLMEVGPNGKARPSAQGYLPPHLQQDTWMSNDPSAMMPPTAYNRMNNQQMQGLPQNFLGAPQLPTHDPELYDEVLRFGPLARGRSQAQDPLAILRSLLGF